MARRATDCGAALRLTRVAPPELPTYSVPALRVRDSSFPSTLAALEQRVASLVPFANIGKPGAVGNDSRPGN